MLSKILHCLGFAVLAIILVAAGVGFLIFALEGWQNHHNNSKVFVQALVGVAFITLGIICTIATVATAEGHMDDA